jgi:zinc protease
MEKLNRINAPAFKQVENLIVAEAFEKTLDNGIPLYIVDAGTQDLVKIEVLFKAGTFNEPKRLIAAAVNSLLGEGTSLRSAENMADELDSYGAFFQAENGSDWSSASLYSLTKHLEHTLPLLKEILKNSVFPEKELGTYIQNQKQHLAVNNQRVDFIARKKFSEALFGASHPYGYYAEEADLDALERNDLVNYFKTWYTSGNCKIIVSGKVEDQAVQLINRFLGCDKFSSVALPTPFVSPTESNKVKKWHVAKEDTIQSAIRIGKLMVNKVHPDYMGLQVLNTVLGGYFGSRLMTNIREDKGYTYGIGSAVASNLEAGYFFISTETGSEVCKNVLHEIYYEMNRLREDLIPEEELALVKNYMLGTFLRSIDGPFELANKFKGILTYGLGYDYYHKFIETIKSITPEKLRTLATIYFQEDSMLELVVGKTK